MYYSKNNLGTVSVPRNYGGNAFKVVDESERRYIKEPFENNGEKSEIFFENSDKIDEKISEKFEETDEKAVKSLTENEQKGFSLSSFFSDISVEDVLLLGLIFVIHQENSNDSTLLLLLILLLAK